MEKLFHELRHKEAENEIKKGIKGARKELEKESGSHTAHCLKLFKSEKEKVSGKQICKKSTRTKAFASKSF